MSKKRTQDEDDLSYEDLIDIDKKLTLMSKEIITQQILKFAQALKYEIVINTSDDEAEVDLITINHRNKQVLFGDFNIDEDLSD